MVDTPLVETFTAIGVSETLRISEKCFNVSRVGGEGTVALERSFNDGVTWHSVLSMTSDFEGVGKEIDRLVLYRFNCTAYTSGSIYVRLSRGNI
jgi:hypothetical protein